MTRFLLLILLAGCTSQNVSNTCLPLKVWTGTEQDTMAAEIDMLPPSSLLIPAMEDYAKIREETRACNAFSD